MPTVSVRSIVEWSSHPGREKRFVYEERITLWNASSMDEAIELAERESNDYANSKGFRDLGLFQAFWMFSELGDGPQGVEVFSLLRESDLPAEAYLDAFFDEGSEHQRKG